MKILLAVDGSDFSQMAADAIAERPWPPGSQLKILTAKELPFVPTPETWALPESYYREVEEAADKQASDAIKAAKDRIGASGVAKLEITTEIIEGHAKDVILDEAERWGADLIVLGSHGYRGWQRFLLGSVSHAVAAHATCSVEIVRRREKE